MMACRAPSAGTSRPTLCCGIPDVDGQAIHCLNGHRDEKGNCHGIALSTLDFEGQLQVTDPDHFLRNGLPAGIGPAKAFGCGLLLVRRC